MDKNSSKKQFFDFTFIKHLEVNNKHDTSRVIYKSRAMTLTELLQDLTFFIKASGFHIKPGAELILLEGDDNNE